MRTWEAKNFVICTILTSIVCIFIFCLFHTFSNKHEQEYKPDIEIKVIKALDQGEYANNFIVMINTHTYHMSINKVMHNVFFYHDSNCKMCKINNNFVPYTFSLLDNYSYDIMKDK